MKTTRLLSVLLIVLAYSQVCASDSTKVRKNEIGINAKLLLITALKAESDKKEIGISYKRAYKNSYLRAYLGYSSDIDMYSEVSAWNDSILYTNTYHEHDQAFLQRLGIEKRKNIKNKIYFVYGIDLISKVESSITRNGFIREHFVAPDSIEIIIDSVLKTGSPIVRDANSVGIGAGLTLAIAVPIGKRWMITAENRSNLYYAFEKIQFPNPDPSLEKTVHRRFLDLQNELLISTVTVSYLF